MGTQHLAVFTKAVRRFSIPQCRPPSIRTLRTKAGHMVVHPLTYLPTLYEGHPILPQARKIAVDALTSRRSTRPWPGGLASLKSSCRC